MIAIEIQNIFQGSIQSLDSSVTLYEVYDLLENGECIAKYQIEDETCLVIGEYMFFLTAIICSSVLYPKSGQFGLSRANNCGIEYVLTELLFFDNHWGFFL